MPSPTSIPSPQAVLGSLTAAFRSRESLASSSSLPRSPASTTSLPSLTDAGSSSSCSSLSSISSHTPAPNEHLAVLLPRNLWKQDIDASYCDTFVCRKPFTLMDRRHHCRKCGGIFCRACSSRTTPLLDTTELSFVYPPRGTPIATYASPISPVLPARVCEACYAQIHGTPTPNSPSSSSPSSPSSSTPSLPRRPTPRRSRTHPLPPPPPDPSLPDDLRSYPLRIRSDICKATGGGRWIPKPSPIPDYMKRVPGRKAPYEIALEEEEAAARRARSNPVIRDGDFQYRPPRPHEPSVPERPLELSTF
ncbi:FYVE zinc finger-domain-containing protein [Lactifluus subvellereus]|nr:FYVE zinc finger-domain-containing protein [Lactifluus subvellereus]